MFFGSRNKLAVALVSGGLFAVAPHFAVAQQAPGAQTQQAPALSAEQVAEYIKEPAKLLADFKDNPEGLSSAVTQMAMTGTAGAEAATAIMQAAATSGDTKLAAAAAKGLGVAAANLTKAGNLALAQSIQASVAAVSLASGNKEMADALSGSFASGQGGTATAATTATGAGDAAGGTAGTGAAGTGAGGNGSSGGVNGAANGFASSGGGGANTDSSTSNSASGSSFSGTGSSSVPASPT